MATTIARLAALISLDPTELASGSRRAQSLIESLRNDAEALTRSLRTPFEVYRDEIQKLQGLRARGFISEETFGRGVRRAAQDLYGFNQTSKQSASLVQKLGLQLAGASHSFGPLGGAINTLATSAGGVGVLAAGLGAAAIAAGAFAVKMASIADASRDIKIEAARELAKAIAERDNKPFVDTGEKTNKELLDNLKQEFANFAELTGLSLKPLLETLGSTMRSINILAFGQAKVDAMDKANARAKLELQTAKEIREETAKRAEEEKRHAEEMKREQEQALQRMKNRAESLTQSLRTPIEILRDSLKELDQLRGGGFISEDSLSRGIAKAAEDYRQAAGKLKEAQSIPSAGAALERGSVAEFSARIRGDSENKERDRVAKEQLATEKLIAAEVKKFNGRPPVTFQVAHLN